ncbi:BadF/BadG/BcrA/BcrD ATPase family protein [Desulfothermus okinawensis JCM 13304]
MITAGIDIGSTTVKCAILKDGEIIATAIDFTGYNVKEAWKKILYNAVEKAGISRDKIDRIISTGYGRESVDIANKKITEITCHGAGAHFLQPNVRTVIDIGGQDSKAISLDKNGRVLDFVMNDKCAAGTGRFLEVMARAMEVDLDQFGKLSMEAKDPVKISSLCTVFAESEVISMISQGKSREDIIAGIHRSIASRVYSMASRLDIRPPIMLTGGVAKNKGLVKELSEKVGQDLIISPYAQLNGAIGAAYLAQKQN